MNASRRALLKAASCGFGYVAFAGLAAQAAEKSADKSASFESPLAPKPPHFEPKAKRVIFLCMRGGPSHVDTFDYKPSLEQHAGKAPGEAAGGLNSQNGRTLLPSPFKFTSHGQSGLPISELYPHLAQHADQLCLINGAHTDLPNHPQALVQLHTGNFQFVRPSMGAWLLYGLGTDNQDLPGFITIKPPSRLGGAQNYGSAFLPAVYQGTKIDNVNAADGGIGNIRPSYAAGPQRKQLELLQSLNRDLADRYDANSELDGVIESYELAFRMQAAVPELMNLDSESAEVRELYGIGERSSDEFGRMCLMARRFVEAGVRFVELTHEGWDQHNGLRARLTANCQATDKPMAGLLTDLQRRGLLRDTLVVWGGEFGRTPAVRNQDGRDHNSTGFSMWMAGGGVKGGVRYGATDELGISAEVDKFHTHDFHATLLHLMGLDHTRLTYRYAGRDFRLTDVYGRVAEGLIA